MPTVPSASRLTITLFESARATSVGHRLAIGGSITAQMGTYVTIAVIAASISAAVPTDPDLDERPSFLAPFQQQHPRPVQEQLSFAALGGEVAPMNPTTPVVEEPRPVQVEAPPPELSGGDGKVASDAIEEEPQKTFSDIEVDSAVVRDSLSAGPDYPPDLMAKGIEGSVLASFIVDTTGLPDLSTFIALEATHPEFATAVRAALPKMKFRPAIAAGVRVRQLVEQRFAFRIIKPVDSSPPKAKKP